MVNAVEDGFAAGASRHDFDLVDSRDAVASVTSILAPAKPASCRAPTIIGAASEPSRASRAHNEMEFLRSSMRNSSRQVECRAALGPKSQGESAFSPYWIFNLCATQTQAGTIAGRALAVDARIDPAPERGSGAVFTISCRSEQSPRLNCRPPRHQRSTLAAGSSPPPAAALFVGASCLAKSKVSVARRLSRRVPNRSPTRLDRDSCAPARPRGPPSRTSQVRPGRQGGARGG